MALDPYSTDGHDGIVRDDGVIMNDETVEYLCRQAVSQVRSPGWRSGCRISSAIFRHVCIPDQRIWE